jgi:hypothetical protein
MGIDPFLSAAECIGTTIVRVMAPTYFNQRVEVQSPLLGRLLIQ